MANSECMDRLDFEARNWIAKKDPPIGRSFPCRDQQVIELRTHRAMLPGGIRRGYAASLSA